MFRIDGFDPDLFKWLPAYEHEFDNQERATKAAWRFRVLLGVPVRLLQDNIILWSDPIVLEKV